MWILMLDAEQTSMVKPGFIEQDSCFSQLQGWKKTYYRELAIRISVYSQLKVPAKKTTIKVTQIITSLRWQYLDNQTEDVKN